MVLNVLVYFSSFIIGIILGATVVLLITRMGYQSRLEKKIDRILAALEQSR